jgi:hypothetical protein
VVELGKGFPFWLHGGAHINLRATAVNPGPIARLGPGTELIVTPRLRVPSGHDEMESRGVEARRSSRATGDARWVRVMDASQRLLQTLSWKEGQARMTWCTLFVMLPSSAFGGPAGLLPGQEVLLLSAKTDEASSPTLFALPSEDVPRGHAALSPPLQQCLATPPGTRLRLQPLQLHPPSTAVQNITLTPLKSTDEAGVDGDVEPQRTATTDGVAALLLQEGAEGVEKGAAVLLDFLLAWMKVQLSWAGSREGQQAMTIPHGAVVSVALPPRVVGGQRGGVATDQTSRYGVQHIFRIDVATCETSQPTSSSSQPTFPVAPGVTAAHWASQSHLFSLSLCLTPILLVEHLIINLTGFDALFG